MMTSGIHDTKYMKTAANVGNASNYLPAVTARVGDSGLSVLEAWDSIFKALEADNCKELDSNEDIIDYAIGKCSG